MATLFLQSTPVQALLAGFSPARLSIAATAGGPPTPITGNAEASGAMIAEELLADFPVPIRVEAGNPYDANGAVLMHAILTDQPLLRRSDTLNDSGGGAGQVEDAGALAGSIGAAVGKAVLALLLGGAACGVLRTWFLRARRRAGAGRGVAAATVPKCMGRYYRARAGSPSAALGVSRSPAIAVDVHGTSPHCAGESVENLAKRDTSLRKRGLAGSFDAWRPSGEATRIGGWELDLPTMRFLRALEPCGIRDDDPAIAPELGQSLDADVPKTRLTIRALIEAWRARGTRVDHAPTGGRVRARPGQLLGQGSAVIPENVAATPPRLFQGSTALRHAKEAPRPSSAERYRTQAAWSSAPRIVYRGAKAVHVAPSAVSVFGALPARAPAGKTVVDLIRPDPYPGVLSRLRNLADQAVGAPTGEAGLLGWNAAEPGARVPGVSPNRDAKSSSLAVMRAGAEGSEADAARASLEAQLRESQKMGVIGTLASGIAHDFNNIIASILGNAELASLDVTGANPRALESLEEIRKAATRARALVQQILSFGRRQPMQRKRTALAPVVEEAVRLLRAALPARVTINAQCEADVPPVLADRTHLEQVLINLATNASQAMEGAPGRIGIRLDTVVLDAAWVNAHAALRALCDKHPGRLVRLAVSDSGQGMDPATLEKIFEPFFTTRAEGEGTGLGLSVVRRIVQAHDGAMVVESQQGKGATFTLYLPAADAVAAAAAPGWGESAAAASASLGYDGGPRILYIDDDESLVSLVERLLERRGCRVSAHTDQQEGLAALRADPAGFDFVVTDFNMPGMSGLDVARAVRAIRTDLPVTVASGFVDEALRTQARAAGAHKVILKANAVDDLCEAFAQLAQEHGRAARDAELPGDIPVSCALVADAVGRRSSAGRGGARPQDRA